MSRTHAPLALALVLLLTGLLPACGGGGGGGDEAAPGTLAAGPRALHLVPVPGQALDFELRWSPPPAAPPTLAGGGEGYLVFRSPFPVTEENLDVSLSFYVEATSAVIGLDRDSGLWHLRVASLDADDRPIGLSEELVVDTTERVYARVDDAFGSGSILAVRPDGTGRETLSTGEVLGGDHFVSPLGGALAYRAARPGTDAESVLVARTDGGAAPVDLVPQDVELSQVQIAAFSADGRWLAFRAVPGTSGFERRPYLARTDVPGTATEVLEEDESLLGQVTFTPDGTELLYPFERDGATFLAARAVDSPSTRKLTPDEGVASQLRSGVQYAVSPDGQRLAYLSSEPLGGAQLGGGEIRQRLHVLPLAGGEPITLDDPFFSFPDHTVETWGITSFVWSPDGETLGCLYVHHDGTQAVWLVASDGQSPGFTVPSFTFPGNRVGPPQFTPDSQRVLFAQVGSAGSELYVADVEPDPLILIVSDVLVPGGGVTQHFVSPDGARVIYLADALVDGRTEVFAVELDRPGIATRLNGPLAPGVDVRTPAFSPDGQSVSYAAGPTGFVVPADASAPATVVAGGFPGEALRRLTWPGAGEQR